MMNIRIENAGNLERDLQSFGSSIAECLEDAVMAGGMIIVDQAAKNAPYKSGTLASATGATPRITRVSKYRVEGRVGPQGVAYARIQEFGGLTGRGHRTRIQGKFYMTRAVQTHRRQAEDEMIRVIALGVSR